MPERVAIFGVALSQDGVMAVLNKYHHGGKVPPGAVNIMRGTPFGNPFEIGKHGDRAEVVRLFRDLLWRRMQDDKAFSEQVKALHGRDLCCCCAPAACHGDVLASAAAWLNQAA